MTDFNISRSEAERLTGLKIRFFKTTGAKSGTLSYIDADGGEPTLTRGTKKEAEKFLDGVIWAMRHISDADFEQKIYDKVQRQYDIAAIKGTAENMEIQLTEEQAERAVDFFDNHFSSDVGLYAQWESAVEAVTK